MVEIHKVPYIRPQGSNAHSMSDSADHFNIALFMQAIYMKLYMIFMFMIQSFRTQVMQVMTCYTLNVKTQMYTTYIL